MGWLSRFSAAPNVSKLAAGKRVYAIGDVHGRNDLLCALLAQIQDHAVQTPAREHTLVLLGDYVDRGPASKAVIDTLLDLDWPGWKFVFLRGNHDQAVLDFLADANFYRAWRSYGAPETLLSYGVMPPRFEREAEFAKARDDFAARIPQAHLEFLQTLQLLHIEDDYLFAHAGIKPGIPIEEQIAEDLLWIRDEFLNCRRDLPKKVVHGHTPTEKPVIAKNRIGIDTGAHATHCLTAAILEDDNCHFLQTTTAIREESELARA